MAARLEWHPWEQPKLSLIFSKRRPFLARILGTTEGWPKRPRSCPGVDGCHHHHHQVSQAESSPGIGETSCLACLEFKFPANRVLFPLPAWLAWWWQPPTPGQNFRRLGRAWFLGTKTVTSRSVTLTSTTVGGQAFTGLWRDLDIRFTAYCMIVISNYKFVIFETFGSWTEILISYLKAVLNSRNIRTRVTCKKGSREETCD